MLKKIIILSFLVLLFSCSKSINSFNDLLSSKPIQKELSLLQQIETSLDNNLTNKEQEEFLLKIANDFKTIKNELKTLNTGDDKIKSAVDIQIKLCEVYEKIEKEIKDNGIEPARKYLKEAEEYYKEFIKIIEISKKKTN